MSLQEQNISTAHGVASLCPMMRLFVYEILSHWYFVNRETIPLLHQKLKLGLR